MTEAMIIALQKGGFGAGVVALMYVLSKLIDKYKPTSERRADDQAFQDSQLAGLRAQITGYQSDIDQLQKDVRELRDEVRFMSRERHYFYDAITRCTTAHPATAEWWQNEMSEITKKLGRP